MRISYARIIFVRACIKKFIGIAIFQYFYQEVKNNYKLTMISNKFKSKKLLLCLLTVYLSLFGCNRNDLDAAEQFGLTSASFQDATNKLSNDIYDSCIRRSKFAFLETTENWNLQQQTLDDCEKYNKPAAQKAQTASQVISDYMKSIGELASTNTVDFDKSLKDIQDSLTNLEIPSNTSPTKLNSSEVQAGINIISLLLNWDKQIYQRKQIKTAIICTDEPFQEYSTALIKIFQDGYIKGILAAEKGKITEYYKSYAIQLRNNNFSSNRYVKDIMEIEQKYAADINSISVRQDASISYISVIQKTAMAHQKLKTLFSKGNTSTSSNVTKDVCKKYFTLQSKRELTSKSLENSQITLEERKRIAEIASQYTQEVKPLLQKINQDF